MINQLLKGLQGEMGGELAKISGFNTNQLDDVLKVAGNAVSKNASSQIQGGNKDTLMNLFSSSQNNNSANGLQNSMNDKIVSELATKLGIDENVAKKVAGVVLPAVLGKVTRVNRKTPDNDSSPLDSLFGGGGAGDIGGMLNKLF